MSFKYIIFNNGLQDIPVIFPMSLCHMSIAESITTHKDHKQFKVVSAGFVDIGMECSVYGGSDTLNVKSREEDSNIISMYPYLHGIQNTDIEPLLLDIKHTEKPKILFLDESHLFTKFRR